MLAFFTARDEDGKLAGYCVFIVRTNPHYAQSLQAAQDVVYVAPWARGTTGQRLFAFCEEQLREQGVQAIYHHVKAKPGLNFGPLLERRGYEAVDIIYAKRLDKPEPWSIHMESDDWEKAAARFATDGGD